MNVKGMQSPSSSTTTTPTTTTICYPMDGKQLHEAVVGQGCVVIMLTRDYFHPYVVMEEMVVSSTKVIMGNPLILPVIRPSKIERLFHGKEGRREEGVYLLVRCYYHYYYYYYYNGCCYIIYGWFIISWEPKTA